MIDSKRILQNFKELVSLDSPSLDERLVCEYIKKYLKNLGIDAVEDNAGEKIGGTTGNLYAYLDGTIDGESVLFAAHMDTVEPSKGKTAVVQTEQLPPTAQLFSAPMIWQALLLSWRHSPALSKIIYRIRR